MEMLQLFFLGLSVGFISSFFGIGGGSLIVPVLYTLYPSLPASTIIPVSLGSVFLITTINTYKFSKLSLLPSGKLTLNFLIFCSLGALTGTEVLHLINTQEAKKIMGFILIIMILRLLLFKSPNNTSKQFKKSHLIFALTGFLGAFISSITGLGGGIIFTPIFINVLNIPMKFVSPFSNLAMLISTLIGLIPHFFISPSSSHFTNKVIESGFIGEVNMTLIMLITFGAIFSTTLGVKYNASVSADTKKVFISILLFIFSLKLLLF